MFGVHDVLMTGICFCKFHFRIFESSLLISRIIFAMNENLKLRRMAEAKLPTEFGHCLIVGFEEISSGRDHIALVYGDITTPDPVLSRIHSECLTGDTLFSLKCDCGHQLGATLSQIGQEGRGVLLYHRQEGRGIGLVNKIRAYALQDKGLDTVEANLQLGFKPDERDFTLCADMYKLLGVRAVRLITNNPLKVDILKKAGINVVERVPIEVGRNGNNDRYLKVKAEKLGHLFKNCNEK
uniref:GTP cyclohydrolase n=1 Tax=Planococcus citri TaxID=170843 RepID=S5NFC6_9HEMI|nr:GTP cyclohydrolase [Planococcus citri]